MPNTSRASLECEICHNLNYRINRSANAQKRLAIQKYCNHCKKKTLHKETK
ncbi:MAG TPA: 50S ribosomal protein L33 [Patescibacteria group bacterium]|nr:50S ribosomal protein L33 [Patescibacteria group bacterium]